MEKSSEIASGIGQIGEKAFEFIEKLIAAPIMVGTGILTDKIQLYRIKNQVELILKVKKLLEERGINVPKQIPIKDLSTILEFASFEDEEPMQSNWANLLANTVDPDNQFNACHVFSQILNQISVNEYYILKYMFSRCFFMSSEDRPYFPRNEIGKKCETDYRTAMLLIDNLLRLRLIEEEPPKLLNNTRVTYLYEEGENPTNEIIASDTFRLSQFGVELMRQIS
ncbi:MAG TPA: Abi-alpha family protein [Flavobacterium sp.]|jgi:hypothetical protein